MTRPLDVRDLTPGDLPDCGWSGSALHLDSVARELVRAEAGEVDYLVVCTSSGSPIAIGGVDFAKLPGAGYLYQLGVRPAMQRRGVGTLLVRALEDRIRRRGLARSELCYERHTSGNGVFYRGLGYLAYGTVVEGWEQAGPDGTPEWYETTCVQMRRDLTAPAA
ncbi:GNAT family N-acetyltransferase [Glycomyces dulcitolivorans]|uniref:GNAT family N-acetyltransferase n=1 Tax=Glycomyces dulcitolivorans TaxID=2200759 RepID=UPI000DD2D708|nr:GNAT family N-acetyltransferase [Glycomyces dulcitolivorans]